MWEKYLGIFIILYIYFFKRFLLNFKYLKKLNFTKKNPNYFPHILVVTLQLSAKFKIYMLHSLRDIKKTNSKKYEGVGETLLRQNFS
jgi:hypothetical protein